MGNILQNSWSVIFKNINVLRVKEVLGKCSKLNLSKETRQLSAIQGIKLDPSAIKGVIGTKLVILKCGLRIK